MTGTLPFSKIEAAGNDYVYVDGFHNEIDNPSALAKKISDRHFGVGSDGLIIACPSQVADLRMRMFNADGSEGRMCGNGARGITCFAFDKGLVQKKEISIETLAGIKNVTILDDGNIRVDMGEPVIGEALAVNGTIGRNVSMGNPHFVIVTEEIDGLDLEKIGPTFENAPIFPDRINTEFIEIMDRGMIKMRVWERGSGETLACGTGASAAVVALHTDGLTERQVAVHLRGGILDIEWNAENNRIYMAGGANLICDGEYYL